jgi:hypothetical protein
MDRRGAFGLRGFHRAKSRGWRFDPETGGVRKVRWSREGSGKRGGVRVIYFYYRADVPLYLLMVYAKARREDLSPDAKRAVQALAARIKQAQRR